MANLGTIAALAELDGVLLVDKPEGVPSHDIVKLVKSHFNLVKVGHGGTLDTGASGLFLLLIGDATRLSGDLMGADRSYEATIRLGVSTNTFDKHGDVVSEKDASGVTREAFDAILPEFKGDVFQTPPEFSAVQIHGELGYSVVRDEGERKPYLAHVYKFLVKDFAPSLIKVDIVATKGLVVRSYVDEIGRALGCGAHLESLRRTKVGPYVVDDAIPFMEAMRLHPGDFASKVKPLSKFNI